MLFCVHLRITSLKLEDWDTNYVETKRTIKFEVGIKRDVPNSSTLLDNTYPNFLRLLKLIETVTLSPVL